MSFDRLAPFYRALEICTAGGKLQRCRTALLDEVPEPRRILLAGEGHGRSLEAISRRFPKAEIVAVDSSARMLEIAARQAGPGRVTFIHADLLEWNGPAGTFDLIVTHFFLDCFPERDLAVIVARLGRLATPAADWLLADFQVAPGRAARLRSRAILALLYGFFRITCRLPARSLIPPDGDLEKAGFTRHRRVTHDWGLLKSEWWRRGGRASD